MYLLKVRLLRCIKLHSEMATELCQYIHVMRYEFTLDLQQRLFVEITDCVRIYIAVFIRYKNFFAM